MYDKRRIKKDIFSVPRRTETGANMIHIILCDDDARFLDHIQAEIRSVLKKAHIGTVIHTFTDAENIPEELLTACDLYFLDIDFPGKKYTGIDIARRIRQVRQDSIIIFLTNYIEYAPEGYEVQAFRYVLKSDILQKLEQSLREAMDKLSIEQEFIRINISGEPTTLYLDDILYIEAMGHSTIIHTQKAGANQKAEYKFYSSLVNMEQQLCDQGFLRIQKSYLVNMRRIQILRCSKATLDNGTTLPVSEKTYAEQKKKYLLWKGQR